MSEAIEQELLCNYIKTNYPNIIFLSDASGIKMTMGQAVKWSRLKSHRGYFKYIGFSKHFYKHIEGEEIPEYELVISLENKKINWKKV